MEFTDRISSAGKRLSLSHHLPLRILNRSRATTAIENNVRVTLVSSPLAVSEFLEMATVVGFGQSAREDRTIAFAAEYERKATTTIG